MNNKKSIKTILFASLIAAMILPFSGMDFAEAKKSDNAGYDKLSSQIDKEIDKFVKQSEKFSDNPEKLAKLNEKFADKQEKLITIQFIPEGRCFWHFIRSKLFCGGLGLRFS